MEAHLEVCCVWLEFVVASLVGGVDWCASWLVRLICCQNILLVSSPESVELLSTFFVLSALYLLSSTVFPFSSFLLWVGVVGLESLDW